MTRQFKYRGWHAPDIVQTPDGQVWVSVVPPSPGLWNTWVEVERIQSAESFSYPRNPYNNPFGRSGPRSGRGSGDSFRRPSPESQSKYGVRDHRPMNPEYAEQARLYAMSVADVDPDILKNLFGKPMA